MKIFFEKLGYSLVILGFFVFIVKYKVNLLYLTDYLTNGKDSIVLIQSKMIINNTYIYDCIVNHNGQNVIYSSYPTIKNFEIGDQRMAMIAPLFKIVLFGKFVLIPYIVSLFMLFFLLLVSIIAGLRLLNFSSITILGKRISLEKAHQNSQ